MKARAPFQPQDLADLDEQLLDRALAVVTMAEIHAGVRHPEIIGLRHDVDENDGAIQAAVQFARWEHDRGYRASYFILHTAPYWRDKTLLRKSLEMIAECGHEIGIHNNALAGEMMTGQDAAEILAEAIAELCGYGFPVTGTVAHGDKLCRDDHGQVRFVNDELFVECARPEYGAADRNVGKVKIKPRPLADFGLEYEAGWLPRGEYLSESGGVWRGDGFDAVAAGFPSGRQLHMLVHPDWWPQAFSKQEARV